MRGLYPDYFFIATNGPVVEEKAGGGVYIPHLEVQCPVQLPEFTSIYDAELLAMTLAVKKYIRLIRKRFIISDFQSVVVFECKFGAL